jgi:hypothetical protein
MKVVKKKRLRIWTVPVLLLIAAFAILCNRSKPPQAVTQPVARVSLAPGNRYDLARDETRGGHTLERHVGKSDAELRQRLENESIATDSTYTDRTTAEMAVAAAVRENSSKINRWLHRPGGHSNLVLDYDSNSMPVGRSMRRDDTQSFPCSHAVAVLKWRSPDDYYVLTSYPDCWRPR